MCLAPGCEERGPPRLSSQGTAAELYTKQGNKCLGEEEEEVRRGLK